MKFEKKGLIFSPEKLGGWRDNTFITPTPYLLNNNVIRVYGGFRDKEGISRIGFIDVNANNPKEIISVSENPVLDIGENGMFDDNGVILGSILPVHDEIWMYYVGFQIVKKAKFLAYSGLAISNDGGNTFHRYQATPVLDRYKGEKYIRAIHSVIYEEGKYKIWYSAGERWEYINDIPYPQYKIMYTESSDGKIIPLKEGIGCVNVINDEYRIGRPTVFKINEKYKIFYTRDTLNKVYSAGYAESEDGIIWERKDDEFTLATSTTGWDSDTICYPVPIKVGDKYYVFYSGNGMGATGVGYAEVQMGN